MAEFSVFDKLVNKLSTSERREMLNRIVSSVKVIGTDAPQPVEDTTVDLDGEYQKMGLLRRLIIVLIALFTGRDRLSVVESHLLTELRRRTASRSADFDASHEQLRPSALESFRKLSRSARHFAAPLSRVMGRERAAFVAFLAGLHAPDLQAQLMVDSDPFAIADRLPDLKDNDVKRRALQAIDEGLVTLPAQIRGRIYHDVRSLHHLMALASFPFERLLSEFAPVAGGDAVPVPLGRLAAELGKLAGILGGLYPGPSAVLLEAISLYNAQDCLEQSDEHVEGVLQSDVTAANEAYAEIVSFAERYPVADLVRLAHGNIHWRSVPLSGGEDWFAVWKGFWQDRVERLHRRFSYKRKLAQMARSANEALGIKELHEFPGYPPSGLDSPAKHGLSLGLVRAVFGEVYSKQMEPPLTALYRDGEFYKADNRNEFDEAMREIDQIRTEAANIEVRLQPKGDLGRQWAETMDDSLAEETAAERRESLANQIDADASAIVRRMINAFRSVANVVEGVLFGTVGGRYDTISNLGQIGAPDARALTKRLESALVHSKAITEILAEMINLESLQQG